MIDRFNALDIGGFHAGSFACRTSEKLVMQLSDFWRVYRTTKDDVGSSYELQFSWILGGSIETESAALGTIKSWQAHRESPLLAETLRTRHHLTYGETFVHFELICDQAKVDVVARDVFLTMVGKHGLVRRSDDGTPSGSTAE